MLKAFQSRGSLELVVVCPVPSLAHLGKPLKRAFFVENLCLVLSILSSKGWIPPKEEEGNPPLLDHLTMGEGNCLVSISSGFSGEKPSKVPHFDPSTI